MYRWQEEGATKVEGFEKMIQETKKSIASLGTSLYNITQQLEQLNRHLVSASCIPGSLLDSGRGYKNVKSGTAQCSLKGTESIWVGTECQAVQLGR